MSQDNVVTFGKKPEEPPRNIWTCPCGSQQHYLYSDGSVECYVCGHKFQTGTWSKENAARLIANQAEVRLSESTNHGSADLAKASVLKKARDYQNVAFIFVGYSDGGTSVWRDVEAAQTDDQKAWFRRRADDCLALSFDEPLPPDDTEEESK